MLVRVSPRWMVKASAIQAVGHYKDHETTLTVQFTDGSEDNFECGNRADRDRYLADIEAALCMKKISSLEGEYNG